MFGGAAPRQFFRRRCAFRQHNRVALIRENRAGQIAHCLFIFDKENGFSALAGEAAVLGFRVLA